MSHSLFVAGTDTGVGKTRVACALIVAAREAGLRVAGFKPVASGAMRTPLGLRNDDAEQLLAVSSPGLAYADVNPCCFEPPIAPHLAAREVGTPIDLAAIDRAQARLAATHDLVIIEGAGGWQVPLDDRRTFADWVQAHDWPVLLVVGIRLGCISHALLSAESIERRVRMTGWVANCLPPVPERAEEQIADLRNRLSAPLWGRLPTGADRLASPPSDGPFDGPSDRPGWLDHCGISSAGLANPVRGA
jgi:dethiobiotin synthetase